MLRIKFISLLSMATIGSACAQNPPNTATDHLTGTSKGTLTCKTESAMVKIMKTIVPPNYMIDRQVMNTLIEKGACLIMPDGWQLLEAQDPPHDQMANHASKWTIRTPNGIVHMWGAPIGED